MGVFVGAGTSSFLKDGEGVGVTRMDTSTRNNLSGANRVEGQVIYNTDKKALQIWNGTAWVTVGDNFEATGGTKSTSGNYTYHLFESPGNFVATGGGRNLEVFVVGGGGAGGSPPTGTPNARSGGGGGGGAAVGPAGTLGGGTYAVVVGSGGARVNSGDGGAGGTSSFAAGQPYAITATGGAGGKAQMPNPAAAGGTGSGGSTNGTGGQGGNDTDPADSGNTPVSYTHLTLPTKRIV